MTQADALAILKTGVNVFLTGEPGAGKSHTVREYVTYLRAHGVVPALTASTGIAATHIHGTTIHSWSGLGIRRSISMAECRELASNAKVAGRIRKASVLILDEVSMLDASLLESVDKICRVLRRSGESFGGLQVVLVGDFFQLPPVSRADEPLAPFAFLSQAWVQAGLHICYLSEQHRQEDAVFSSLLSALRQGAITEEHIAQLQARCAPAQDSHITKLYAHNVDVDALNDKRLKALQGETTIYTMQSYGDRTLVEAMKRGCLSPERLALKVGARVMCTRNSPAKGYVNGSLGDVTGFDPESGDPFVRLHTGKTVLMEQETWSADVNGVSLASIRQIPLRLAWAMTIHKSQGMSLDSAFMDLRQVFAYGQGYVALSRVRTLEGLFLGGLNARALEIDPIVRLQDDVLRVQSLEEETRLANTEAEEREKRQKDFLQRVGGTDALVAETVVSDMSMALGKKKREPKWKQTLALLQEGKTLREIATARARTLGTILDHVVTMQKEGHLPPEIFTTLKESAGPMVKEVHPIMEEVGALLLAPVYARLQGKYSYDDLRVAQWLWESERANA